MSLDHAVKIIPFFTTPHVGALLGFYKTHLGDFKISAHPPDTPEPTFASIAAGPGAAANIYILQDGERARGSCMVMLDSLPVLGQLYERLVGQEELQHSDGVVWTGKPESVEGASAVIGPLEDKPWGYRQFDLVDPHGNLIVFFAFLEGD